MNKRKLYKGFKSFLMAFEKIGLISGLTFLASALIVTFMVTPYSQRVVIFFYVLCSVLSFISFVFGIINRILRRCEVNKELSADGKFFDFALSNNQAKLVRGARVNTVVTTGLKDEVLNVSFDTDTNTIECIVKGTLKILCSEYLIKGQTVSLCIVGNEVKGLMVLDGFWSDVFFAM